MKYSFNKDKMLTIGILPAMWLVYFLFEERSLFKS